MPQGAALKQRLREGRPAYALIHGLASPAAAELAALAGYDVVVIDDEHGAGGRHAHLALLQAVAAGGAASVLRLASHDAVAIGQALDLGVDGLMIPGVHTPEQALACARATRYPPAGTRGHGLGVARASGYGLHAKPYGATADASVFLSLMIESAQGVEHAQAIAATEGVDAIVVGLHDLAVSLGLAGDVTHRRVQQALAEVEAAVLRAGKVVGTIVHPGGDARTLVARGHRFITLGADTRLLGAAMRQQLEGCPDRMRLVA